MVAAMQRTLSAVLVMLAVGIPAWSAAAVIASVDRDEVELNESFTLKVIVDSAIEIVPDVSALDQDFYIGSTSQLSNTTIVNGQISRSRTWTYMLMAKHDGQLTIPPIIVGAEQSDPVRITVSPQADVLPGEADIFVTSEVDHTESFVQAQILYTVKVYRAVATRQPRLSDLSVEGVEVLKEMAGEERSYDSILNGKAYNVVERVYALFPQDSGELNIAPARFEARVLRDNRITGRKIFESAPINVLVSPIPPPPADFPDAAWFPAKSVELSQVWSRPPDNLPAGEPVTRHITVTALGQLETQIPVIEPKVSDSIKVYPDKPELRNAAVPKGILASRKDQYAMIGVSPGTVELPELKLPWWNIDSGVWEVATLPGATINILPSANALPVPPPIPEVVDVAVEGPVETVVVQGGLVAAGEHGTCRTLGTDGSCLVAQVTPGTQAARGDGTAAAQAAGKISQGREERLRSMAMPLASRKRCSPGVACNGQQARHAASANLPRASRIRWRKNCACCATRVTDRTTHRGTANAWRKHCAHSRCCRTKKKSTKSTACRR